MAEINTKPPKNTSYSEAFKKYYEDKVKKDPSILNQKIQTPGYNVDYSVYGENAEKFRKAGIDPNKQWSDTEVQYKLYDTQSVGERFANTMANTWSTFTEMFDASLYASWHSDMDNYKPKIADEKNPVYYDPYRARRTQGAYLSEQFSSGVGSLGILGGMILDPVNAALVIPGFGVGATGMKIARVMNGARKLQKVFSTGEKAEQLARTISMAERAARINELRTAKQVGETAFKAIKYLDRGLDAAKGVRSGYLNTQINREFNEDAVFTEALEMGYTEEQALDMAKKAGKAGASKEMLVDILINTGEALLFTKPLTQSASMIGRYSRSGRRALATASNKSKLGEWAKFFGEAGLLEAGEELWEEAAAVYGEYMGKNYDPVTKTYKKDPDSISFFDTLDFNLNKDRYIDAAIGGAFGGLLLGGVSRGLSSGYNKLREKMINKQDENSDFNDVYNVFNLIAGTNEKEAVRIREQLRKAQTLYENVKKNPNATKEEIQQAEEEKNKALKLMEASGINGLIRMKLAAMNLQNGQTDDNYKFNTFDKINDNFQDTINALNNIIEAQKQNDNLIEDFKNGNLSDDLKESFDFLIQSKILNKNGSLSEKFSSLEDVAERTLDMYLESVNMDLDLAEGYFDLFGNMDSAVNYMIEKSNLRKLENDLHELNNTQIENPFIDIIKTLYNESMNEDYNIFDSQGNIDINKYKNIEKKILQYLIYNSKDEDKQFINDFLKDYANVKDLEDSEIDNIRNAKDQKESLKTKLSLASRLFGVNFSNDELDSLLKDLNDDAKRAEVEQKIDEREKNIDERRTAVNDNLRKKLNESTEEEKKNILIDLVKKYKDIPLDKIDFEKIDINSVKTSFVNTALKIISISDNPETNKKLSDIIKTVYSQINGSNLHERDEESIERGKKKIKSKNLNVAINKLSEFIEKKDLSYNDVNAAYNLIFYLKRLDQNLNALNNAEKYNSNKKSIEDEIKNIKVKGSDFIDILMNNSGNARTLSEIVFDNLLRINKNKEILKKQIQLQRKKISLLYSNDQYKRELLDCECAYAACAYRQPKTIKEGVRQLIQIQQTLFLFDKVSEKTKKNKKYISWRNDLLLTKDSIEKRFEVLIKQDSNYDKIITKAYQEYLQEQGIQIDDNGDIKELRKNQVSEFAFYNKQQARKQTEKELIAEEKKETIENITNDSEKKLNDNEIKIVANAAANNSSEQPDGLNMNASLWEKKFNYAKEIYNKKYKQLTSKINKGVFDILSTYSDSIESKKALEKFAKENGFDYEKQIIPAVRFYLYHEENILNILLSSTKESFATNLIKYFAAVDDYEIDFVLDLFEMYGFEKEQVRQYLQIEKNKKEQIKNQENKVNSGIPNTETSKEIEVANAAEDVDLQNVEYFGEEGKEKKSSKSLSEMMNEQDEKDLGGMNKEDDEYDLFQLNYTKKNDDGEYEYVCDVTDDNGNPVISQKGFARLHNIAKKYKNGICKRIYVKGFNNGFEKDKEDFREYLKFLKSFKTGNNNYINSYLDSKDLDNDAVLEALYNNRKFELKYLLQPIYATDNNGEDEVIIGFIPQFGYYVGPDIESTAHKSCKTDQIAANLNNITEQICIAQEDGDVEFEPTKRTSSYFNFTTDFESVQDIVTEDNISNGIKEKGKSNYPFPTGYTVVKTKEVVDDEEITNPVILHIPGSTVVKNGQIILPDKTNSNDFNLRQQNSIIFDNFKVNILDIVLKYIKNVVNENKSIDKEKLAEYIVKNYADLFNIKNVEEAINNLTKFFNDDSISFSLKDEIEKKKSNGALKSNGSFLINETISNIFQGFSGFRIELNHHGNLIFNLKNNKVDNKEDYLSLSNQKKDIADILNYVNEAFKEGGSCEKMVMNILDNRTPSHNTETNHQYLNYLYDLSAIGQDFDFLKTRNAIINNDTKPKQTSDGKNYTVLDMIKELARTNLKPVALYDENHNRVTDVWGNNMSSIFRTINYGMKVLKTAKEENKPITKKEEISGDELTESILALLGEPEETESYEEKLMNQKYYRRQSKDVSLENNFIIEGFSVSEQHELAKSLFGTMIFLENIRKQLMNEKFTFDQFITTAKKYYTDLDNGFFSYIYKEYSNRVKKLTEVYDYLNGEYDKDNPNPEILKIVERYTDEVKEEQKNKLFKRILELNSVRDYIKNLVEDEYNIDCMFHIPTYGEKIRLGSFVSYASSILKSRIKIKEDETDNIAEVTDEVINKDLDHFIKGEYEIDPINDFSVYLKCILSNIQKPKYQNTKKELIGNNSFFEFYDVDDVISLISNVLINAECNWDDVMFELKKAANDETNPNQVLYKQIVNKFNNDKLFPLQYKKELQKRLINSLINFKYANIKSSEYGMVARVNSISGEAKTAYLIVQAKNYINNANYRINVNGVKKYDMAKINVLLQTALSLLENINNNNINNDSFNVLAIQKFIQDLIGVQITSEAILYDIEVFKQLCFNLYNFVQNGANGDLYKILNNNNCLNNLFNNNSLFNQDSLNKQVISGSKSVNKTYHRTLRDKLFLTMFKSGSEFGLKNHFDYIMKMFKDENGNFVFPQLEHLKKMPFRTGLNSLSALEFLGKNSKKIVELASTDQTLCEALYNQSSFGSVEPKTTFHIKGFKENKTFSFNTRSGYSFAYTASDKTKLAWIQSMKIILPSNENALDLSVFNYVTQQLLDTELLRIENEFKAGIFNENRHIILSIPELNLIKIPVEDGYVDLETLLRTCNADNYQKIFEILRNNYDGENGIFSQAKTIVRNTIDKSVAQLILNNESINNNTKILDVSGKVIVTGKNMKDSLWEKSNIIKIVGDPKSDKSYADINIFEQDYIQAVLNNTNPNLKQADIKVVYAAYDQIINIYLTNTALHNLFYGPLNNYQKSKATSQLSSMSVEYDKDGNSLSSSYDEKLQTLNKVCLDMTININKRMAGIDGSGNMLDFSGLNHGDEEWGGGKENNNSLFNYIVVDETHSPAMTYDSIFKRFYPDEYDEYKETIMLALTGDVQKQNELRKKFPDIADYLDIDSTDGAEFITPREAVDWLMANGKLSEEEYDKLQKMYDKFGIGVELDDKEALLLSNLINKNRRNFNPVKPMAFGVMPNVDENGNPVSLRTFYGKSAAIVLLPQFTANTMWDDVRIALDFFERTQKKNCRLIFKSAVKIGAPKNTIKLERLAEIGKEIKKNNKNISFDGTNININQELEALNSELYSSSVLMDRKFLMSQMETDTHSKVEYNENEQVFANKLSEINSILNNGQTKVVDSTQLDHIIDSCGFSSIEEEIFELPQELIEKYNAKHTNNKVSGKEYNKIRTLFIRDRIRREKEKLFDELGITSIDEINFANKEFIKKLNELLSNELLSRNQDSNILSKINLLDETENPSGVVDFKTPFLLNPLMEQFQNLLMSIIRNRISKNKISGNAFYTMSPEGFSKVVSDKDYTFERKGTIWIDKNAAKRGCLGSRVDKNGNLILAEVAISSQFNINVNGKIKRLDLFQHDKKGKLIYLCDENGNPLYVDKNNKIKGKYNGIYLNTKMFDDEMLGMMTLRIPVSGHMSACAVKIVAFLPDELGDTIIVPKEHFKQLGEDLDIDKRFCYMKNYFIAEDGKVKVLKSDDIDDILANYKSKKQKKIANNDEFTNDEAIDRLENLDENIESLRQKLEEKLYENYNIDLYYSIYRCSDNRVQKEIQKVLGFEDLKATRDLLLEINDDSKFISIYDPIIQQELRIANSSSLMGVGAMSLAVVQNGILNKTNGKTGSPIMIGMEEMITEGDPDNPADDYKTRTEFVPLQVSIDGLVCSGSLSETKTLDGLNSVSETISALQNANVDNVKENLCGIINLNQSTFPFYELMAMLGFNKTEITKKDGSKVVCNVASLIASQKSVVEYSKLQKSNDSLVEKSIYSDSDKIKAILLNCGFKEEEINNLLGNKSLYNIYFQNGRFYSTKENILSISGQQLYDLFVSDNPENQLKAFAIFWNVTKSALGFTKYSDLFNTTSKGVGTNFFDIQIRKKLLNDIAKDTNFKSLTSAIGEFYPKKDISDDEYNAKISEGYVDIYGIDYLVKPMTPEGIVLIETLQLSDKLLSVTFGYNSATISTIYQKIINYIFNLSNFSKDDKEKAVKNIPIAIQEYLYKLLGNNVIKDIIAKKTDKEILGLWDGNYIEEENRLSKCSFDFNPFNIGSDSQYIQQQLEFAKDDHKNKKIAYTGNAQEHVSLGYIIRFLQDANIDIVLNNKFLNSLDIIKQGAIRVKKSTVNTSSTDIINGFIELYNMDSPIKINGNEIYANGEVLTGRKLAKDIAAYAFICDSESGVLNLRQYIPDIYMDITGTNNMIRYIYDNIKSVIKIDDLTEQFFLRFPEFLPKLSYFNNSAVLENTKCYSNSSVVDINKTDKSAITRIDITIPVDKNKRHEFLTKSGLAFNNNGKIFLTRKFAIKDNNGKFIIFERVDDGSSNIATFVRIKDSSKRQFGISEFHPNRYDNLYDFERSEPVVFNSLDSLNITTNKEKAITFVQQHLDINNPVTKLVNLFFEYIKKNDDIHFQINNSKDNNFASHSLNNGKHIITLNINPNTCTSNILFEEMLHCMQMIELSEKFEIEQNELNGTFRPIKPKNDKDVGSFGLSYSLFVQFHRWWNNNGGREKFFKEHQKLASQYLYSEQINETANNFAEFIAAGASMQPVFLEAVKMFEKEYKMSENNIINKIINSIKTLFKNIINKLFGNENPETVNRILDETIDAINKFYIDKSINNISLKDGQNEFSSKVEKLIDIANKNFIELRGKIDPEIQDGVRMDSYINADEISQNIEEKEEKTLSTSDILPNLCE